MVGVGSRGSTIRIRASRATCETGLTRPIGCVCDGDTRAECTAPTITLGRARCVTHRRSDEPAEELLPQSTSTWPVKPTYRDTSGQRCVIVCEVRRGAPRLHRPGEGFRILHPPGDDDQPDHPRQVQDPGQHDSGRVRLREALGADHPALHQVGEAGEPHQVGDRPREPRRPQRPRPRTGAKRGPARSRGSSSPPTRASGLPRRSRSALPSRRPGR